MPTFGLNEEQAIMNEQILQAIIDGRMASYVSKSSDSNPYVKRSDVYDWHFEKSNGLYVFKDIYRGFNPYSGIEAVYLKESEDLVWTCDYVGFVLQNASVNAQEVYAFLKESRGKHLKECEGKLFSNFEHHRGQLRYQVVFEEHGNGILEKADIFYDDKLVAQHIGSGMVRLY